MGYAVEGIKPSRGSGKGGTDVTAVVAMDGNHGQ